MEALERRSPLTQTSGDGRWRGRRCYRRRLRAAHVALRDKGIVDQIVNPVGWNDLIGNVVEIPIAADEGDAEPFAAFIFEAHARTVGGHHERDVRSNHATFLREGSNENRFVRGVAFEHLPQLSQL